MARSYIFSVSGWRRPIAFASSRFEEIAQEELATEGDDRRLGR